MTKEHLDILKGKLPIGWADSLAKEFSLSATTIRSILRGDRNNHSVIKGAVVLMRKHQSELESLVTVIENS